ncbi:hypothetical protein BCR37DRAFT_334877, partial [Protomyces lactucae-debilis]
RALLRLSGRDTFKYLQTQTTNNLKSPQSQYTCFLNAQGRVLHDAFIYKIAEDACYLEVDAEQVAAVKEHLLRYKLRCKFVLEEVDPLALSVFSTDAASTMPAELIETSQDDLRGPDMGLRVLAKPDLIKSHTNDTPLTDYIKRRFLRAIPEGAHEFGLDASGLPLERNLDLMGGVDFHKGCYLGQELTVRTYHTGVIRKRILPVRLAESAAALPDALESQMDAGDGSIAYTQGKQDIKLEGTNRPVGKLIGRMGNLGLALYRLEKLN